MNTAAVRQIVLGQPNPLPECKSLSRFADTVRDPQSSRFSVLTRGAFIVERAGQAQAAAGGSTTDASQTPPAQSADVATAAALPACPSTFEREPALHPFLHDTAHGVGSAVRVPGASRVPAPVTAERTPTP